MSIQGLLVVKPQNVPVIGAVKTFTVNGDRIKVTPPDKGGVPYRIMSVTQNAAYADSWGNIGFDIEIDPNPTAQPVPAQPIQFAPGHIVTMSKDDYWARKEERDIEAAQRMNRCHAQDMALQYCELKQLHELTNEQLVALIDWWQRDSNRPAIVAEAKQIFNATEFIEDGPEGSEIPFG